MVPVYRILLGALLLCLGRKLFWLFVGVLGFVIAGEMAAELLNGEPAWVRLLISVLAGFAGVVVALWMQQAAIAVSGFMAGGYFLTILLDATAMHSHPLPSWITFVAGGIVGALLMVWLFDWTLIVLSSATGTTLVLESFHLTSAMASAAFVVLFALGILFQSKMVRPMQRTR